MLQGRVEVLYDAWIAATGWSVLYSAGYAFLKHSNSKWEYARRYELDDKLDRSKVGVGSDGIPYITISS